jgi:hypothetical protein
MKVGAWLGQALHPLGAFHLQRGSFLTQKGEQR